ncbi:serine hydrolase [Deinococcus fonticola]|uniref:serine hydrolase n=1 Tax=Deinococcus fonticola TaxID=2528713 RepID=UPI0010750667|nr:serine hydrolase [Deinococcus fonticola]
MKRLLTFLLSLTPLLTVGTLAQSPDPLEPILTFARTQPGDLAISVATVLPDGTLKPALRWNDTQAMPLASSMKVVVLAAYARAVSAGKLNPDTPVKVADWEAYYLPGTDGGAHAESLKTLGIGTDQQGRATTPEKTVPLDTLARFMIETSDNAATDLILSRLGKEAVPATIRALGLKQQEDIGPVSGLFGNWDKAGAAYLKAAPAQRRALDWQRGEAVRRDPALRQPPATEAPASDAAIALAVQLQNQTPPRGSTADYAALMGRVLSGEGFHAAELALMRRHLGWPMRVNLANAQVYNALYAKGGSLGAGVLTNNLALDIKGGPRVVYSIFLRNIPENSSAAITQSLEGFMLDTLFQSAAQQRLLQALGVGR